MIKRRKEQGSRVTTFVLAGDIDAMVDDYLLKNIRVTKRKLFEDAIVEHLNKLNSMA